MIFIKMHCHVESEVGLANHKTNSQYDICCAVLDHSTVTCNFSFTAKLRLKFYIIGIPANTDSLTEIRVRRSPQGPPPPLPIAKSQIQRRKQQPVFEADDVFRADDRADLGASGSLYAPKTYKGKKGKVGPVYTFVKTDYDANFKWGVRHVAGKKYAGH